MTILHAYIISWKGQHQSAIAIAEVISKVADITTITYSDPDDNYTPSTESSVNFLKRSDALFWGDKFKSSLDDFKEDLMLIIHADCTCSDWGSLVQTCKSSMERFQNIGLWAPHIDYTPHNLLRTLIGEINGTSLAIVAQTDAIVFCISKVVAERLRLASYESNVYGWGFDTMAAAFAYSNKLIAVADKSQVVTHPKSRGYPAQAAQQQCTQFLSQLNLYESIQNKLLWEYVYSGDKVMK